MFKSTLRHAITPLALAFLLGGADAAIAAGPPCTVQPGSYIRTDVVDVNTEAADMIALKADGTAYYYQGNAVEYINSGGTLTPAIGSWSCGPNDTVVMTAISYETAGGDNPITDALRITFQLQFTRRDISHPVALNRVYIDFPIPGPATTAELLDPNGGTVIASGLDAPRKYALVTPFISDLSR